MFRISGVVRLVVTLATGLTFLAPAAVAKDQAKEDRVKAERPENERQIRAKQGLDFSKAPQLPIAAGTRPEEGEDSPAATPGLVPPPLIQTNIKGPLPPKVALSLMSPALRSRVTSPVSVNTAGMSQSQLLAVARRANAGTTWTAATTRAAPAGPHGVPATISQKPGTSLYFAQIYGQKFESNGNLTIVGCNIELINATPNPSRNIQWGMAVSCSHPAITGTLISHLGEAVPNPLTALAQGSFVDVYGGYGNLYYWASHDYHRRLEYQQQQVYGYITAKIAGRVGADGWYTQPSSSGELVRCNNSLGQLRLVCEIISTPYNFTLDESIPCQRKTNCTADEIEEDNDNYDEDVTYPEVPNPEDQVCDPEASSCALPAAFYVGKGTPRAEIPAWVLQHQAFTGALKAGVATWGTIYFDNGAATTTRAATRNDCLRNFVCLFQHSGFRGQLFKSNRGVCRYTQLSLYGFNDKASSWANRRRYNSDAYADAGVQQGRRIQLTNRHSGAGLGPFNDKASALQVNPLGAGGYDQC